MRLKSSGTMSDRIYCDTSVLISLHTRDAHHDAAVAWKTRHADTLPVWTPFHRVEIFNGLRQLAFTGNISQAACRMIVSRLTYDLGFYYTHLEPDWRDVMRTANEISAEVSGRMRIRTLDLLHVAHAREVSASTFVTADNRQAAVAEAVGLPTTLLD